MKLVPRWWLGSVIALSACKHPAVPDGIPPAADAALTRVAIAAGEEHDDADADAQPPAPAPLPAWAHDAATKITAHAKGKTRAWQRLAVMADTFGHRLSGSAALERAIDWTLDTMRADGLSAVRRELVKVPHWVRGRESLRVTAPVERELAVLGLGMSVGTRGTLAGEVAVVDHVDEIAKQADRLKDKIVLINQRMPPYDHEHQDSSYGPTVSSRSRGASEAAKVGAKAVLVRSVTAVSLATPHTGSLSYADDAAKIPAAAVTHEGADLLARLAARGPTRIALRMDARLLPDADSGNAIGEITGREKPDEIVVIGGHIDSWDVGDGSTDDGSGCMMAMEAAAMLVELGLVPRRTIRVVLFTNEENGLRGAQAYFDAHGTEPHAGAIEADSGSGAPRGFGVKSDDEAAVAAIAAWAPLFAEIGAGDIGPGWGGADISPLTERGVISLSMRPDTSHYFDLHHSPADTIDKIDPDHLQRNAAAMALMAYLLAERP